MLKTGSRKLETENMENAGLKKRQYRYITAFIMLRAET